MAKNMTIQDFKGRIRETMGFYFGFRPVYNRIILLESNGDGSYIRFRISDIEYVVRADEFFPDDVFRLYKVHGREEVEIPF